MNEKQFRALLDYIDNRMDLKRIYYENASDYFAKCKELVERAVIHAGFDPARSEESQ